MKKLVFTFFFVISACDKSSVTSDDQNVVINQGPLNKNITRLNANYLQGDLNNDGNLVTVTGDFNFLTLRYTARLENNSTNLNCQISTATIPTSMFMQFKGVFDFIQVCRNTKITICPLYMIVPFQDFLFFSSTGKELSANNFPDMNCATDLFACDRNVANSLSIIIYTQLKNDIALCLP